MSDIQFGVNLRLTHGIAETAQRAEALGFDVLSCGEHVSFHVETANGLISLAVAAGATRSIRLMSAITLAPLYPAALLAKQGAALDVASGGRFMMGVGIGGEFPKEFEACGVPLGERGPRTDEALEVMRRTWTEASVSFKGRFTTLDRFSLKPLPVQKPRPPIWVAGRKDSAMRRTARFADGWLPYMYTPEQLAASVTRIAELSDEVGREDDPVVAGMYIFFAVHEDSARAVEMANARLSKQYNQDFSKLIGKYALAGTPDQVRARLAEYLAAGARLVIVSSACPDEYVAENEALMAREVLGHFRNTPGGPA